jgi:nucleoside-diphosphate-sugar epimerase
VTSPKLAFPRVAITGGAGYVGSALVPALLARGHDVSVLDLFLYGEDVFEGAPNRAQLRTVKGDIRDPQALLRAFEGADAVIHLACISNDPSFELDPALGKSINFDAFSGILRAVKKTGAKRFIYASSSSVYGVRPDPDVREDSPKEPLTDYSKFKLLCEDTLQKSDLGSCDWVVLRPATVCGYAPRLRLDLTVNILTINALVKQEITVYGGSQLRPNVNILDMVEAYLTVLDAPSQAIRGEVFNAGYENHSVAQLAEMVQQEVADPKVKITVQPTVDLRSYHINSDKIADRLGFKPRHSIRDAVRSICEAYRAGRIPRPLEDPRYYNIRVMQNVGLK